MQVPIRKPGKYTHLKPDPHLTEAKFNEFKAELEKLQKVNRPRAAEEVKRLAEFGDFSDNPAYGMAKGRLRGINQRILDLENQLKNVEIIKPSQNATSVQMGHTITIESEGKQKTYLLLGSSETNPEKGIISHSSPLGTALMGKKVGETVKVTLAKREVEISIVRIE